MSKRKHQALTQEQSRHDLLTKDDWDDPSEHNRRDATKCYSKHTRHTQTPKQTCINMSQYVLTRGKAGLTSVAVSSRAAISASTGRAIPCLAAELWTFLISLSKNCSPNSCSGSSFIEGSCRSSAFSCCLGPATTVPNARGSGLALSGGARGAADMARPGMKARGSAVARSDCGACLAACPLPPRSAQSQTPSQGIEASKKLISKC